MNTKNFRMAELFGEFLANGSQGDQFRICEVEPALNLFEKVQFDFEGVRNMTDSFANACFANLTRFNLSAVEKQISFVNCSPLIRGFIVSALERGAREAELNGVTA